MHTSAIVFPNELKISIEMTSRGRLAIVQASGRPPMAMYAAADLQSSIATGDHDHACMSVMVVAHACTRPGCSV